METSAQSDSPRNPILPPPSGAFKLVPPPHPGTANNKFKPNGMTEVSIVSPQQPVPTEFGHLGLPAKPAAPSSSVPSAPPAPPSRPMVIATAAPSPEDDDAKILARMEKLLKIEKRVNDLEAENDLLLQMVNRLKAENAALKAK